MKWTKKSILLILALTLVIISGILPLINIFASSYNELPSQTVIDDYVERQPVEKSLPPTTANTKESDQIGGEFQQPSLRVENPGTSQPPVIKEPDRNLQQPGQSAQEPNTTPQPVQKGLQSYPGHHYPWFHQMNPDYQPNYEWYRGDQGVNWDNERWHG